MLRSRLMKKGKQIWYTDSFWELDEWVYTSTTERNTMMYLYSQPVYTDGTRGEKTLQQSLRYYDSATYVEIRYGDWNYYPPQFYSNPYYDGFRIRWNDNVWVWNYDGSETLESAGYERENATITYDEPSYWIYYNYSAYQLSVNTPPNGWRGCNTTVYSNYSDYTQISYNHMYRDYQSSYQLVFVAGQGHYYLITFASGATYQTPWF